MIGTITIKNTTITLKNATKYEFNSNKCYKIDRPHIFIAAYICNNFILMEEIQGFLTDDNIEPKTSEEFVDGLHNQPNLFYLDAYDSLFDSIILDVDEKTNKYTIACKYINADGILQSETSNICKRMDYFHLFKKDDLSWNEIDLDLEYLYKNDFLEWSYFGCGILSK